MIQLSGPEIQGMFDDNLEGWNKRTAVHKDSAFYDVHSFKKGKTSLNATELNELGDVKGKTLLHLQCHFGMDTLSWEREGAIVTGVDFSDAAIDAANNLKSEMKMNASFICANVYDLPKVLDEKFDIVFTSYGVIGWLPDLNEWARIIQHFLKPGGTFYMAEFHPVVWMMDDEFKTIKYHYHNIETITETSSGTYADTGADIQMKEHSWNHSLGEVINALIEQGITIQSFNEFSYSNYNCFKNLVQGEDGNWRVKGLENKIPMMFSVKGVKL